MKKSVIVIVIVIVLTGCATTRQTQVVRETTRDTLYLNHIQYDSIYIDNQTFRDYRPSLQGGDGGRPDTIYVEKVRLEYKYKLLRDTVYKVQIDSIPVIREVEVIKTERYIPKVYKLSFWICVTTICVIFIICAIRAFIMKFK